MYARKRLNLINHTRTIYSHMRTYTRSIFSCVPVHTNTYNIFKACIHTHTHVVQHSRYKHVHMHVYIHTRVVYHKCITYIHWNIHTHTYHGSSQNLITVLHEMISQFFTDWYSGFSRNDIPVFHLKKTHNKPISLLENMSKNQCMYIYVVCINANVCIYMLYA